MKCLNEKEQGLLEWYNYYREKERELFGEDDKLLILKSIKQEISRIIRRY